MILSSHAIPGNEGNVNKVIDGLLRAGCEVIHSGIADVHATGHAQADELKTYLSIARPRVVRADPRRVPPHGRQRQARARDGRRRATTCCCARTATCSSSTDDGLSVVGRVPAGYLYVDGIVGDVGQGVLRDRKLLAEEGVVVVVVTVDVDSWKVLTGPRSSPAAGCTHPRPRTCSTRRSTPSPRPSRRRWPRVSATSIALEKDVRRAAGKFVNERTRRRPMIVPVVMEA